MFRNPLILEFPLWMQSLPFSHHSRSSLCVVEEETLDLGAKQSQLRYFTSLHRFKTDETKKRVSSWCDRVEKTHH